MEVEPPEDMDETQYDIDPSMMIWKSMTGQEKQPLKAEEDLDDLYHPSMDDLLKVQIQNREALPAADIQSQPSHEDANTEYNQVPEEDKDDIDHPVFSSVDSDEPEPDWDEIYHKMREELDVYLAPLVADREVRAVHTEPEKVELYHHDEPHSPEQMEQLRREVRVHLQPEEDMDDLYHADLQQSIPYQDDAEAAAPYDQSSQRRYSEPEEDLDDLYHR